LFGIHAPQRLVIWEKVCVKAAGKWSDIMETKGKKSAKSCEAVFSPLANFG
jgi:hypothetical protein